MNITLSPIETISYLERGKTFMAATTKIFKEIMDKVHSKCKKDGNKDKKDIHKNGIIVIEPVEEQPQTVLTIQIGQKQPPDLGKGLSGILGKILGGQRVEGADTEEDLGQLLENGGEQPEGEEPQPEGEEGQEGAGDIESILQQYDQETLMQMYEALKAMFEGQG